MWQNWQLYVSGFEILCCVFGTVFSYFLLPFFLTLSSMLSFAVVMFPGNKNSRVKQKKLNSIKRSYLCFPLLAVAVLIDKPKLQVLAKVFLIDEPKLYLPAKTSLVEVPKRQLEENDIPFREFLVQLDVIQCDECPFPH